jgi:hypothetical protein
MERKRSASAEATTAQASTPPLAPEPANPSVWAVQPSAGTGAGANVPEVEHTASGVFEVSLERPGGFGARHRSATKDTGSRRGQGCGGPVGAGDAAVFVSGVAVPAAGRGADARCSRRRRLQHEAS